MKAITAEILAAWALLADGAAAELPLAGDLYPPASLEAAKEAFAGLCDMKVVSGRPSACRICVQGAPDCGLPPQAVIGAFFNYLLQHAWLAVHDEGHSA